MKKFKLVKVNYFHLPEKIQYIPTKKTKRNKYVNSRQK